MPNGRVGGITATSWKPSCATAPASGENRGRSTGCGQPGSSTAAGASRRSRFGRSSSTWSRWTRAKKLGRCRMNLYLEKPLFLLVIPVGVALVWLLVRQRIKVGFSQNELLTGMQPVPLYFVQKLILSLAIGLLGIALAQPMRYTTTPVPVYVQARDIVVSLDISGSMASPVIESGSSIVKLKLAKSVIEDFVSARPQDRISIVVFDTRSFLEWSLSIDHRALLVQLEQIRTTGG